MVISFIYPHKEDNRTNLFNYSLSLLSTLSKTLAQIVHGQLYNYHVPVVVEQVFCLSAL